MSHPSEKMDRVALRTPRLLLRPFILADAPPIQRMVDDFEVATGTLNIPHPFPEGEAERWVSSRPEKWEQGTRSFAIVRGSDDVLVGAISLTIEARHNHGEVGYWIGREHWGQGYMTEALRAVLRYGFEREGLARIFATHFSRNPASGRVMEKVGMAHEGTLRQHYRRWGRYEDVELYGALQQEWLDAHA